MVNALSPLLGGILIGIAATVLLIFNGRVAGISGILSGFLTSKEDRSWQGAFLIGLLMGGAILRFINPDLFRNTAERSLLAVGLAGLLVGFGTAMAAGCTSGHGVCGMSRLSIRSVVATIIFIAVGGLTVAAIHLLFGGEV